MMVPKGFVFLTMSACLFFAGRAAADIVVLEPSADTTLISIAPDNNLGAADFFNGGVTGTGTPNRGLLFYDLSSALPPDALITGVELSLSIVRQPNNGLRFSNFSLRRMLQSWGEGSQSYDSGSPGLGLPAVEGEATWNARFLGGDLWAQPGGLEGVDFSAVLSGTAFVGTISDEVIFTSSPELIADVQAWLDNPAANFGWMFKTESEDMNKTARSFASRESGFGPMLTINFVTVPEPSVLSLAGLFLVGSGVILRRNRRRMSR